MKALRTICLACCCIILTTGISFAEDYISKNFPAESIISRTINKLPIPHGIVSQKFVKSAGKYQDKDGLYHYYYFATSQAFQGQALLEIKLIKLDTDAWTIENAGFILEK